MAALLTMSKELNLTQQELNKFLMIENEIIELFEKKEIPSPIAFEEYSRKSSHVVDFKDPKFIQFLEKNQKIHCDKSRKMLSYKTKYQISNAAELKALLLMDKKGIKDDKDLWLCYDKCKEDVEKLKARKEVRIVSVDDQNRKKYTVLYGKDMDDPIEREKYEERMPASYRKKWQDIDLEEGRTKLPTIIKDIKKQKIKIPKEKTQRPSSKRMRHLGSEVLGLSL